MQTTVTQVKRFFEQYTTAFLDDDDYVRANLQLKIEHTRHVCDEIDDLTNALDLNPGTRAFAHLAALLHDIGRFPQFAQHRTYNDADSFNHSLHGAQVLIDENPLASLAPVHRDAIIAAVRHHGDKRIPSDLTGPALLYTQLVRDADKLDIYRVLLNKYTEYYKDPAAFPYEIGWSTEPVCSPPVIDAVLANRPVDHTQMQTLADSSLARLAWVYDINFTATLARIQQRRYLEQTMGFLPDTPQTRQVRRHINAYVNQRLTASPTP